MMRAKPAHPVQVDLEYLIWLIILFIRYIVETFLKDFGWWPFSALELRLESL